MRDANRLAEDYVALWNEPSRPRRLALLEQTWTADATYADPLMRGSGRDEIDALIAAAQERFPGFRFALLGPADGVGEHVRFSWGLGPQAGDAIVKGTDFVLRDGDRIRSVTGFFDQVPAGL